MGVHSLHLPTHILPTQDTTACRIHLNLQLSKKFPLSQQLIKKKKAWHAMYATERHRSLIASLRGSTRSALHAVALPWDAQEWCRPHEDLCCGHYDQADNHNWDSLFLNTGSREKKSKFCISIYFATHYGIPKCSNRMIVLVFY